MAESDVQVCNLALGALNAATINNLSTDTSKEAVQCNLRYGPTRDAVLRSHPWNFAIKRVAMALDTTAPEYEFNNKFALPVDCLRALGTDKDDDTFLWKIEGRFLLCNSSAIKIKYIAQITDPTQFDAIFTDALWTRLAAELSLTLTGIAAIGKAFYEQYLQKLKEARGMDGAEGFGDVLFTDRWLEARLGSYEGLLDQRPFAS